MAYHINFIAMRRNTLPKSEYCFGTPALDAVVLFKPSIVTPLSVIPMCESKDGEKCLAHVNDIYMLFNQERLNLLGRDNVNSWLSSLNSSVQSAVKQLPDSELMKFIKSRHIQSPSELQAYASYLTNMAVSLSEQASVDSAADADSADADSSSAAE